MITKEEKKEIKVCGFKIESENPITLKSIHDDEKLIGLPAELFIKEIMDEAIAEKEAEKETDFSSLKKMNDNDNLLVTANVNYADEFDMSEWTTMTVSDLKNMVKKLKNYKDEIEWYFGTNEDMRFDDGEDLLSNISFKKITPEENDVLMKLFGGSFDGGAGTFEEIHNLGNDEDEDENEDNDMYEKKRLNNIEILKKFGWVISPYKKDKYMSEFKNENGDYAISHLNLAENLVKHYSKK